MRQVGEMEEMEEVKEVERGAKSEQERRDQGVGGVQDVARGKMRRGTESENCERCRGDPQMQLVAMANFGQREAADRPEASERQNANTSLEKAKNTVDPR